MNRDISSLRHIFSKIYSKDTEVLESQLKRYTDLSEQFTEKFGEQELHYFSTPGRTEIGGNHTDHNYGRVLAGSVNLDSIAVATKNQLNSVVIYSMGYEKAFQIDLDNLEVNEIEFGTTTALIRGIASRLTQLGYQIGGFNAYIESDVLPGSGLSSSASIEVLIGSIFSALFNDNSIAPENLAIIGQYAENNYFGKPCGLMDQVACAMGGIITIDFETPEKPKIEKIDFDFEEQNYNLIVVDTGGNHADLTEDYASVPIEMRSVAQALGKNVCREISMIDLIPYIKILRSKVGDRALLRAIHFIGENERVTEQVNALKNNDFDAFLELLKDSGNSSFKWLQNIYSTKNIREQGLSLALAITENYIKEISAGACRVHGGGFAGTIQVFLPHSKVKAYHDLMAKVYGEKSVHILSIRPLGTLYLNPFFEN